MLPNFIIAGAARAGTTSLCNYLSAHPEIYMSPFKEPHFFSFVDRELNFQGPHDARTNEREIITQFEDYEKLFKDAENEEAVGECSNSYLYFPVAADNIKKAIPHCKIIIMLRNPVERTYSHYRQAFSIGHDTLSFEEALAAEPERLQTGWRWHYQYRAQSMYYKQVRRFVETFGKSNVRIYKFDMMEQSLPELMIDTYRYLGVDPDFKDYPRRIYNQATEHRSTFLREIVYKHGRLKRIVKPFIPVRLRRGLVQMAATVNTGRRYDPPMQEATRKDLSAHFKADILGLQDLLNMDFSSWLQTDDQSTRRNGN
jgi:hypothetical protein